MESLDKHLSVDIGYRLCAPSFSKHDPRVGQMSNSMPGHAENGGCYCHAAGFKGVADCMMGRAEKAWETFIGPHPTACSIRSAVRRWSHSVLLISLQRLIWYTVARAILGGQGLADGLRYCFLNGSSGPVAILTGS